jgi:lipoprotein-releasing system ATP-binding protein
VSDRLVAEHLFRALPPPDAVVLVNDVSFTLPAGQFTAIQGPSGCGKSSLLYLLGLLDRPSRGGLTIDGADTGRLSQGARTRLRLEKIGFVFQFHFLLPELTATQNVELPMRRLGVLGGSEIAARAAHLLEIVGLGSEGAKRPERMSGGQRQRVAVARALANDPVLILGDEPTGNLDSVNSRIVVGELRRLAHEEGRAVICVTHDPEVAAAADRRIQMLDGRIVSDGD